jgi:hypothetical protein
MSSPLGESPSRLLSLPLELQEDIIGCLDVPSKLCLRLVSLYFKSLIPRSPHSDLLVAEKTAWGIRRGLYTCMDCTRLRPSHFFADAMKKGSKGRNGKEPQKRFCIDCGLKPKWGTTRYSPGTEIEVEGRRRVWCKDCRRVSDTVACAGSGLCEDCHGPTTYCRPPAYCAERTRITSSSTRGKMKNSRYGAYDDYDDDGLDDDYNEDFWESYDPSY